MEGSRLFALGVGTAVVVVAGFAAGGCDEDEAGGDNPTGAGGAGGAPPVYVADCGALCDATVALGCDDETCVQTCVSANETAGVCGDVLGAYVACLALHSANISSCYDYPAECEDAFIAYAMCSPGKDGCGPATCDDPGEGSCSCFAYCDGVHFRKSCTQIEGGFNCSCEMEGEQLATCFESNLACHIGVGCCAQFLPENGGVGGAGAGGGGANPGGGGAGGGGAGGGGAGGGGAGGGGAGAGAGGAG